jgi:signal transduction histidine kinase
MNIIIVYYLMLITFFPAFIDIQFNQQSTSVSLDIEKKSPNLNETRNSNLILQIDLLNKEARDLSRIDKKLSEEYASKALELSRELNYIKGMGNAYRIMGVVNYHNNNYFLALEYIKMAMDSFEAINDMDGLADTKISIGHIYYMLNQKDLSLKNHQEAYDHFKKTDRLDRMNISAYNLAESLSLNDSFELANKLLDKIIFYTDSINDHPLLASSYNLKASISEKEGNHIESVHYIERILDLSENSGFKIPKVVIVESLLRLARIKKSQNDFDLSLSLLKEASKISDQNQISKYLAEIYRMIIEIHLIKGSVESALFYLAEFQEIDEYLDIKNKDDLAATASEILANRELEKENKELIKKSEEKDFKLKYISTLTIISVIILTLLILFLVKLVNIFRKEKNLNQTKSKIVSIISHELKTPLATIMSSSELIKLYLGSIKNGAVVEKSKHQLIVIDRQISRLIRIIEDTLVLEKSLMKTPILKIEYFDIVHYIDSIIEDFFIGSSNLIRVKKFGFDKEIYISSDKNLLYHIITNLLSNAYKYSSINEVPEIHIEELNNKLGIKVIDHGIGISSEDQKYIFDAYFRSENVRHIKGTGIGLPVVKMFVMQLKGEIEVHSKVDFGSTFTIYLPLVMK